MISKIEMQGVASYKSPESFETEKKVNILYGLNGTGKSTLSNYLYEPEDLSYLKCSYDKKPDEKILVYNQRFIRDHFYEADSLKGIFSLSTENKDIETRIKEKEVELRELKDAIEIENESIAEINRDFISEKEVVYDKIFEIKRKYTGGDRVLEYCLEGLKQKKPLFNYIVDIPLASSKPTKTIENLKEEIESISGSDAQKYGIFESLSFSGVFAEDNQILNQVITGRTDASVSGLISRLNNSDWVRKGLDYIPSDEQSEAKSCPFCQEKTITKHLIQEIEDYFDQSYSESINFLKELLEKYKLEAYKLDALEVLKQNPFTQPYLVELTDSHKDLESLINENISKLESKVESPSSKVKLTNTNKSIAKLNSIIEKINEAIAKHNSRIDNRDKELSKLKSEFWKLMRWEYNQTLEPFQTYRKRVNKSLRDSESKRNELAAKEKEVHSEIATLQKSTVNTDEAVDNINSWLVGLGITEFSIKKHSEALYRIFREEDRRAEFTSLSEGEKMIISFLYFVELCKGKASATETPVKKVVVIDDPVSSLSHIFVYNVGQLIKTEFFNSSTFEQVFVLTHSLYFFLRISRLKPPKKKRNAKSFSFI